MAPAIGTVPGDVHGDFGDNVGQDQVHRQLLPRALPHTKGALLCQRQNGGRTGLDDHYSPVS
ncbi:hypothetical protein QF037_000597 [Streptomyces canus]|nr:hypothetical protein [Streptomyces canus]